jgi:hypothetical protein
METTMSLSVPAIHYYVKARHWTSDLEFFKIETAFFYRLLNDYFIRVVEPAPMEALKQMVSKLSKLEEDEERAIKSVGDQLKQLELISENSIAENPEELANKQVKLEELMTKVNQEYRAVKNELFALVESAIMDTKIIKN